MPDPDPQVQAFQETLWLKLGCPGFRWTQRRLQLRTRRFESLRGQADRGSDVGPVLSGWWLSNGRRTVQYEASSTHCRLCFQNILVGNDTVRWSTFKLLLRFDIHSKFAISSNMIYKGFMFFILEKRQNVLIYMNLF